MEDAVGQGHSHLYLGQDPGKVPFLLRLFSHFNHLSCVYEKIQKMTRMSLKTQDFAGSEGIFASLFWSFSPYHHTPANSSVFLVLFISLLRLISFWFLKSKCDFKVQNRSLESFISLYCSWREPKVYSFVKLLMDSRDPTQILILSDNLKWRIHKGFLRTSYIIF